MKNRNSKNDDGAGTSSLEDYRDTVSVCTGAYDYKKKFAQDESTTWVPPELFRCNGEKGRRVVMTKGKPQPEHSDEELAMIKYIPSGTATIVEMGDGSLAQRMAWGKFKVINPDKKPSLNLDFKSKKKGI